MADKGDLRRDESGDCLISKLLAEARKNYENDEVELADVAFAEFVEAVCPILEAFFRKRMPNAEWDDLIQETLIKIYRSLGQYDPDRAAMPWVRMIARNVRLDWLSKYKRRLKVDKDYWEQCVSTQGSNFASGGCELERSDSKQSLVQEILRLSPVEQAIVTQIIYSPKSRAEIAAELKMTPGNLATKWHRIMQKLKRALDGFDQPPDDSC